MGRFLFWTCLFSLAGGFILHFHIEVPWISNWIGTLPGDMIIRKNGLSIYFPLASAAAISLVFSVFLGMVSKKK